MRRLYAGEYSDTIRAGVFERIRAGTYGYLFGTFGSLKGAHLVLMYSYNRVKYKATKNVCHPVAERNNIPCCS